MDTTAYIIKKTSGLVVGDVVNCHGMRCLIETPLAISTAHSREHVETRGETRWTRARVLNRDEVPTDLVPLSFTSRPGESDPHWTIQGNDLARWYVEIDEPKKSDGVPPSLTLAARMVDERGRVTDVAIAESGLVYYRQEGKRAFSASQFSPRSPNGGLTAYLKSCHENFGWKIELVSIEEQEIARDEIELVPGFTCDGWELIQAELDRMRAYPFAGDPGDGDRLADRCICGELGATGDRQRHTLCRAHDDVTDNGREL